MIHGTRIILSILFILSGIAVSPGWSVEVGERLPDFAVQTFDGATSSRATLEGRPLLLIFWNTWCPNCMRELPKINRLAKEFGPRGLAVLAINTAINDSETKARAYWLKHELVFPSGFDHDFEIGQAFRVWGVPTIFLVDSKGVVRYKHAQVPENMEERFKQLTPFPQ
jgi:peroxiredoxin